MIRLHDVTESSYTVVPNSLAQDADLSWKARGLLLYLLSLPDDWQVRNSDLYRRASDGKHATKSGLEELEAAGYLYREEVRSKDGTFAGYHYWFSADPVEDWSGLISGQEHRRGFSATDESGTVSSGDGSAAPTKETETKETESTKETSTSRAGEDEAPCGAKPDDPVLAVLEDEPPDPVAPDEARLDPMQFQSVWRNNTGASLRPDPDMQRACGLLCDIFPAGALRSVTEKLEPIHRKWRWRYLALAVRTVALRQTRGDQQMDLFAFFDQWKDATNREWLSADLDRAKSVVLHYKRQAIEEALEATADSNTRGWKYFQAVLTD